MSSYDFSLIRVLVVEDSEFMGKIISTLLNALRVRQINVVSSVPAAIGALKRGSYDLVLTDWEMHPANGGDLVKQIRTGDDSPDPSVPIIAVSAHTDIDRVEEMLQAGVDDVLVKPVSARTIYKRIAATIERPRQFVRTEEYFGPDRRDPAMATA